MELDRISHLPDDITQNILSCLPLEEATRTSVLSSNWRYKSAMRHSLEFNNLKSFFYQNKTSFVNMVDDVLLLHIGPIHSFKLCMRLPSVDLPTFDIDRWIFCVVRNSIKEMIIRLWSFKISYNIPLCVFSCQDLVTIELLRCSINPPATFRGFRCLKNLSFLWVTLSQDGFEKLISCSPLLESLRMQSCYGVTNVKINAPSIQFLDIRGVHEDVNLDDTSSLTDASIELDNIVQIQPPSSSSNLLKFLRHLPQIRSLSIWHGFLKYLSMSALPLLPEKLCEPPCQYLNVLSIKINFENADEVSTALCLLQSFPALQELKLYAALQELKLHAAYPKYNEAAVEEVSMSFSDNHNYKFTQLQHVVVNFISGVKPELDFISFLLLNSPVLESMTVEPSIDHSSELCKDLLRFRRSSIRAEIIFVDHWTTRTS